MSIKGTSGSVTVTGDSAIGPSGKPIRVWNATVLSDGTARDLVLRNGTTDSDTALVTHGGVASKSSTANFAGGLLFPSGCFCDYTASSVNVTVEFEVEK